MTGRLSPSLRLIALLLAVLLPVGQLVDGAGLHHCPDHDAGLGVVLGGSHVHHHGPSHDTPGHGHEGGCPCLGSGHTSQATILADATPAVVVHTGAVFAPTFAEPAVVWPTPSHRLPFAIGPPRSVPSNFA
jgi:hypothetical protein